MRSILTWTAFSSCQNCFRSPRIDKWNSFCKCALCFMNSGVAEFYRAYDFAPCSTHNSVFFSSVLRCWKLVISKNGKTFRKNYSSVITKITDGLYEFCVFTRPISRWQEALIQKLRVYWQTVIPMMWLDFRYMKKQWLCGAI